MLKASSINIEDAERNLAVAVGYEVSCEYDAVGEMIRVNVYNVPISEFSKVSNAIYDLEEEMYPEYGCVFLVIKFSPEETERHFPQFFAVLSSLEETGANIWVSKPFHLMSPTPDSLCMQAQEEYALAA